MIKLLQRIFGKDILTKIIGTRTNVAKPIKFDKNSPFKKYSDDAFNDPKVLDFIEKKLEEYAPYALSNKNRREVANYEQNAKRFLDAKNKQTGTTKGMVQSVAESMFGPLGTKAEKTGEATNVFDIKTKQPVDDKGIATLKKELGLPEGVEPGSMADKAIKESAQYKMDQQGVKSVLDKDYTPPKTTTIEEDEIADMGARSYSAMQEGKRRAVIRQILLKDDRINLPEDTRKSLANYDDLKGGGDPNMDPLKVFEQYYDRDNEVLGTLDGIIDTARSEFEAADEFLSLKNNFKVKNLDDPDDLAEGGRPGFKTGTIMNPQMADFIENYSDQMTFEEYLQMMSNRKNKAGGGLNNVLGV